MSTCYELFLVLGLGGAGLYLGFLGVGGLSS